MSSVEASRRATGSESDLSRSQAILAAEEHRKTTKRTQNPERRDLVVALRTSASNVGKGNMFLREIKEKNREERES
ncbi:hypothetical protein F2Q70_00025728 [Brassica cretica]|uniref:Uncharacterized protein n=1 Tax=Brassica cretica TaxID=69181 RepID=A0A8S9LAD9_BRACR|nr:hypothetical protein F2Q70_00025728 [Brassica cretica]